MPSDATTTKPDVVIVLANEMDVNGVLNSESKVRAEKAVQIFNDTDIPHLVTCGWAYRKDSNIRIADAFKAYMVEKLGVDSRKVITELNSRDTVGDAFFTKANLSLSLAWNRICVVTSDYHVSRTQEIFNFIYGTNFVIDVIGANIIHDESVLRYELSSTKVFRETFLGVNSGNDSQILERLRERHPFYNGEVYDKI